MESRYIFFFETESAIPSMYCLNNAIEQLGLPIISGSCDDNDDAITDEPPPPGLDDCSSMILPRKAKFQPAKMMGHIPLIDKYVTMAVFRQKLHDQVLKMWKSSYFNDALHTCFLSCGALRKLTLDATDVDSKRGCQKDMLKVYCLAFLHLFGFRYVFISLVTISLVLYWLIFLILYHFTFFRMGPIGQLMHLW